MDDIFSSRYLFRMNEEALIAKGKADGKIKGEANGKADNTKEIILNFIKWEFYL